jgi:excisionase family DNA binding protein
MTSKSLYKIDPLFFRVPARVKAKSLIPIQPLFSPLDRRRLIPIGEVAEVSGLSVDVLRAYADDGTIPGARQAKTGKRRLFERVALEQWWQEFNSPRIL